MKSIAESAAWFSFNGYRSTAFGVRLLSMPTRHHPGRKGEFVQIPGRNGALFQDEGAYEQISIPVHCILPDDSNIDAVSLWLSGDGDLVFGDEPERAYHARVVEDFSRSNRSQHLHGQEFTITFDCDPFRYESNPADGIVVNTSGTFITNPGTAASAPLLYVAGTGDGTLMIGGNSLIFSGLTGHIYVDCDAKIAYTGAGTAVSPMVLANHLLTGEWPEIEPGENAVTFTGGITSVIITPRWRWL